MGLGYGHGRPATGLRVECGAVREIEEALTGPDESQVRIDRPRTAVDRRRHRFGDRRMIEALPPFVLTVPDSGFGCGERLADGDEVATGPGDRHVTVDRHLAEAAPGPARR